MIHCQAELLLLIQEIYRLRVMEFANLKADCIFTWKAATLKQQGILRFSP
jgi:hypothetical protein